MKKLSEVCKLVGVTRRTMQEYEKIGLIVPTSKTESGYWLYDESAIQKLILVQIFVECGYERKTVKALLESPTLDVIHEFDSLIDTLEEKHKRIDGMINTVKMLKLTAKLPETTLRALGNIDYTRVYQDKSFSSYLEEAISNSAESSAADDDEAEMYIPFWYSIVAIGCYNGTPVTSKKVQTAVEGVYREIVEMASSEADADSDTELTDGELADAMSEGVTDMLSDLELQQMVEQQCGKGAVEYIIQATQYFCDNLTRYTKGVE